MSTPLLAALLAAPLVLSSPTALPDPCALVGTADIAAALGKRPSPGEKSGPKVDPETGSNVAGCSYPLGDWLFNIELAEFGSAAQASAGMAEVKELTREETDEMRLTPAPGLGDAALWGAGENGAIWVVQRGAYMISVVLAGELGDGQKYLEPLKRLAAIALGRL